MALIGIEAVWEYQEVTNTTPPDPTAVVVPVSSWTAGGIAPFGEGTLSADLTPINTTWTRTNALWMRRFVTTDGLRDVLLQGNVEQALLVYVDGVYAGACNPTNQDRPPTTAYRVVIGKEILDAGSHEIALLCLDDNVASGVTYISAVMDYVPAMLDLQPETPATEALIWLTDVQVSKDGSEQPIKVMVSPRQEFKFQYPATAARKSKAFNTVWGAVGEPWLVPVWTQAQAYGAVAAGLTTLPSVVTDYSEFRAPGLALLWESDTNWQIIGVESVGASSLVINTLTKAFTNAYLMPLREGFMPSNAVRKTTGYEANFEITFSITDNAELTVSAPTQYQSNDLYTDEGLLAGDDTSDDILSNLDIFDPGQGLVSFYKNWTHSKIARTHRVICEDAAEAWAYREFLHRRAGRYARFWQPTFENDLRLENTSTITDTLTVAADEYLARATDRTHIAVDVDGTWYAREITDAIRVDADTIALTLDSALNVAASAVRRVSWLGLHRLNTDRVEIRYPGGGVAQSEFRMLEIEP